MGERQQIPLPQGKFDLVVLLVGISHPGNLGAICRSMLNYGFTELRLIRPKCDATDEEAIARAKHAREVLTNTHSFETIQEAAHDCRVVIGTSGKREIGEKTLLRHFVYPWEFVQREEPAGGKIALVFGEEGMGLSSQDLAACDYYATLPTWEGYPIANLSHAVNAFLYEIHRSRVQQFQGTIDGLPDIVPLENAISADVRQALRMAIEQFSDSLSQTEDKKHSIERTLTRTIFKGTPSTDEATRLIGALVEATSALQFSRDDPLWQKEHRRKLI